MQLWMLGAAVGDVDAEAVDATVEPAPQDGDELVADLGVDPVEVRLLRRKEVEVPLVAARLALKIFLAGSTKKTVFV